MPDRLNCAAVDTEMLGIFRAILQVVGCLEDFNLDTVVDDFLFDPKRPAETHKEVPSAVVAALGLLDRTASLIYDLADRVKKYLPDTVAINTHGLLCLALEDLEGVREVARYSALMGDQEEAMDMILRAFARARDRRCNDLERLAPLWQTNWMIKHPAENAEGTRDPDRGGPKAPDRSEPDDAKKWLTMQEARAALKISEDTVQRRVKDGTLTGNGLRGKKFCVTAGSVGALVAQKKLEEAAAVGLEDGAGDRDKGPPHDANPRRPTPYEVAEELRRRKDAEA